MMLTNDEKAELATELCGARLTSRSENAGIGGSIAIPAWSFPSFKSGQTLLCSDFDPVNNGSHTLLVLEGLVNKFPQDVVTIQLCESGLMYKVQISLSSHTLATGDTLAFAVCTAGLEVLNQKGGG